MTDEFAFVGAHTRADWSQWARRNVESQDDGIVLARTSELDRRSLGFQAMDLGLVPSGDSYVLEPSGSIAVFQPEYDSLTPLSLGGVEPFADRTPPASSKLCTTGTHLFVIDGDSGDVRAYSRRRRSLIWTTGAVTTPIGAVGGVRRAFVVDDDGDTGRVLALDPEEGVTVVDKGLEAPLDCSISPDGTLFVLETRSSGPVLRQYDAIETGSLSALDPVTTGLPTGFDPTGVAARSETQIVLYGYLDETRQQPVLVRIDLDSLTVEDPIKLDQKYETLRQGAPDDSGTAPLYLISASGDVSAYTETRKNRKNPETTRYEGRVIGRLDSGDDGTHWHRLTIDGFQQRAGTRLDVHYFADDDIDERLSIDSLPDIDAADASTLQAAGIETAWDLLGYRLTELTELVPDTAVRDTQQLHEAATAAIEEAFDTREQRTVHEPEDILLDEAIGRYLYVAVELVGTRGASPRLDGLRAYCPRQSYLRYLPEVYRREADGSSFLARFLSLFESVLVDIEAEIDNVTQYQDPHAIPVAYLSWLNSWLAVELGETWPESARRELLDRAPELYKQRGTRAGLLALIDLYFDHVTIRSQSWDQALAETEATLDELVEAGQLTPEEAATELERRRADAGGWDPEEVLIVEYTDLESAHARPQRERYADLLGHPRQFQVLLHPAVSEDHVRAIEMIVESEKPANTAAKTVSLEQKFQLGDNTYLGINTSLPKRRLELERSALGQETQLSD